MKPEFKQAMIIFGIGVAFGMMLGILTANKLTGRYKLESGPTGLRTLVDTWTGKAGLVSKPWPEPD